jgi:hypothetical protein
VEAVTCTRNAQRGQCSIDTDMLQLQVGGRSGTRSLQLSKLQARQGRDATEKVTESAKTTTGRVFSSSHTAPGLSFAAVLSSNTQ